MKLAQRASVPSATPEASSTTRRLPRITTFAVLAALVCFGAASCTRTQVTLSIAGAAAIVAGTTVGITLAIQNQKHTIQGCIFSDGNGVKLRTSDAKIYTLEGEAANIKVGDRVKFHGSKVKKTTGNSTGDQVFVVEKLKKDYGPCPVNVATSAAPTR